MSGTDAFFVRRPIVAFVIAIVIVIVGLVSMRGLPVEQYPDITPPVVQVRATYTGADALSVEQSVASRFGPGWTCPRKLPDRKPDVHRILAAASFYRGLID